MTIEKLFKRKKIAAISKHIDNGKTIFTMWQKYSPKYGINHQFGARWNLSNVEEIVKAIALAKKYSVKLVKG